MYIFGCVTCASVWSHVPLIVQETAHLAPDDSLCTGTVERFIPESMTTPDAQAVCRAEALKDAAIARCEAVASQAQKAIADLYWERRASGRAVVRAYRQIWRLERIEASLRLAEAAPMSVMRTLLAAERLLIAFSRRRPCPSCRGALDHRPRCRIVALLDRITLLTSKRVPPRRIGRASRTLRRKLGA